AQKALQRRHMLALISKGQREKLLDRVFRLGSQALEQGSPAAFSPEDLGIELVGRNEIGAGEQSGETLGRPPQGLVCLGAAAQPVPQMRVAAPISEIEQCVFVDREQR